MMTSEEVALESLSCARKETAEAWAVVKYFYASVHAVNHPRFGVGRVPDSFEHPERNQYVAGKLPKVDARVQGTRPACA